MACLSGGKGEKKWQEWFILSWLTCHCPIVAKQQYQQQHLPPVAEHLWKAHVSVFFQADNPTRDDLKFQ